MITAVRLGGSPSLTQAEQMRTGKKDTSRLGGFPPLTRVEQIDNRKTAQPLIHNTLADLDYRHCIMNE